jgi:hypothetical protein
MNALDLIARTIASRTEQRLGVIVYGLPDRTAPWTGFASSLEQRDRWVASYRAKGFRAEILEA